MGMLESEVVVIKEAAVAVVVESSCMVLSDDLDESAKCKIGEVLASQV